MSVTRDQAWEKLCEWTETDSLRKHARAVEVVMQKAASGVGEPERLLALSFTNFLSSASPDGRFLAYSSHSSGRRLDSLSENRFPSDHHNNRSRNRAGN